MISHDSAIKRSSKMLLRHQLVLYVEYELNLAAFGFTWGRKETSLHVQCCSKLQLITGSTYEWGGWRRHFRKPVRLSRGEPLQKCHLEEIQLVGSPSVVDVIVSVNGNLCLSFVDGSKLSIIASVGDAREQWRLFCKGSEHLVCYGDVWSIE